MTSLDDTPVRLQPDDPMLPQVLRLIRHSFAFMEGRIDPPSSMHRLTEETLRQQARDHEVWIIGNRPDAVVFLTPKQDCLYLSKLAVDETRRGQGLAQRLVDLASARAVETGIATLELKARVELVENHASFARMGFVKTAETAHPGFTRATSITMQKHLG
ncbi:GNAT family N-acetyltransferase [Ruegeria faecimaris]|uniref:Predicted N-acetyltransferase YhbS n=1 Tax=Ruegeria faecimaris TaxID=686389 RepID=A0A521DAE1_9RHOB|nr:Predicted N-acetyltransferase YhbS [Ruegeria faecimaris]